MQIKTSYKVQIASLYEITVKTLNNWIEEYPALKDELEYFGYNESQKYFTIKQIEVLFKYLGAPEDIPTEKIPIKTYTKKKICYLYGVSPKTLRKMIASIEVISFLNEKNGKKLDTSEINLLFEYLGHPFVEKKHSFFEK